MWKLVAAGAVVVGGALLAAFSRGPSAAAELARALPAHAKQFADAILAAAQAGPVDPFLLAALLEQESDYGRALTPPGPGGKGDSGHGHGVGQIDDRSWGAWLATARWWDFGTNATKAAQILAAGLQAFGGNERAGLAAYNAGVARVRTALAAGKDAGSVTTHGAGGETYPDGVLRRRARLQLQARS